jgi:hypothetical protein
MNRFKPIAWRIAPIAFLCAALALFGGGADVPRFKIVGAAQAVPGTGMGQGNGTYNVCVPFSACSGGGGSPTWTGTGSIFTSCGFVSPCTTGSISITGGYVVVGVGVNNQSGSSTNISAVTACGTSLTAIQNPSSPSSSFMIGLFGGTVSGGSCTIVVTTAGSPDGMSVALGTLNNLTSTTPGGSCNGLFDFSQAQPYPCSTSITVSSGGFAIAAFGSGSGGEPLSSTNMTVDSQTFGGSGGSASSVAIAHSSAAGSLTPSFSSGVDFDIAGIAAGAWR